MIFSFGHSNLSQEEFIGLLSSNNINYLIDVRSTPYGTYKKYFSKPMLEKWLPNNNIEYLHLGEELGGKGEVAYPEKMTSSNFQHGIDKIISLDNNENNIALMCAELDQKFCHRNYIVNFLKNIGIDVISLPKKPQKSLVEWF
jgi:uncharacterized protein (DUF488 family)